MHVYDKRGRRTAATVAAAAPSKCVCFGTLSEFPISHHFIELVIMNSSWHHSLVHSTPGPSVFFGTCQFTTKHHCMYVFTYMYITCVCRMKRLLLQPNNGSLMHCKYIHINLRIRYTMLRAFSFREFVFHTYTYSMLVYVTVNNIWNYHLLRID